MSQRIISLAIARLLDSLLRLQIPMHNLMPMTILDCTNNLLKKPPRLGLLHPSLVDDILEQLLPRIFDDHDNVRTGGDHLVELDDMGMSQDFEVLDLSFDAGGHLHVLDLAAVDYLHGYFVACHGVGCHCGRPRRGASLGSRWASGWGIGVGIGVAEACHSIPRNPRQSSREITTR